MSAFASVERIGDVLVVTVMRGIASKSEFSSIVKKVEDSYLDMPKGFAIVLDLMRMLPLPVEQCRLWVHMCNRVSAHTHENLNCICLCFQNKTFYYGLSMFRMMCSTSESIHVFDTRDKALTFATQSTTCTQKHCLRIKHVLGELQ